jgi:hypothetical protein
LKWQLLLLARSDSATFADGDRYALEKG